MTATTSTKASVSANDIDPEQAKRFKLAIVGKPAMTAHLFSDDPELKPKPRILHDTFKELRSELVAANTKERLDVGMTVNRTDGEGRKKENIVEIQCLFLDVDEGTAEPRTFPLQPHLIVNPSPGRYHYYFLVHDCPLDGYEKKLLLLAARYGGDTTDATTERVMRMPGFLNHQYDPPYLVNIVQDNSDVPRYGLDEFKSKMGLNAPQTGLTVFNAHDGESAPEMPSRDRLQKALAAIRTDDYTTCRSVLMALKSVEAKGCSFAKDLAREYSRRSSEHCGRQFDRVWDGFKPRERKILTEETIWYLARKFGYVDSENQPLLQAGEDIDNARMLTEYLARSGFRYLYESKQWVQFNGMGWVKCNDSKPFTAATECFQSIRELAVSATSKAQVKATARLGSGSGIRAAFDIGRRHSRIELSVTDFDRDRLLLGVTNGVLDMASKQLIVPTPVRTD